MYSTILTSGLLEVFELSRFLRVIRYWEGSFWRAFSMLCVKTMTAPNWRCNTLIGPKVVGMCNAEVPVLDYTSLPYPRLPDMPLPTPRTYLISSYLSCISLYSITFTLCVSSLWPGSTPSCFHTHRHSNYKNLKTFSEVQNLHYLFANFCHPLLSS